MIKLANEALLHGKEGCYSEKGGIYATLLFHMESNTESEDERTWDHATGVPGLVRNLKSGRYYSQDYFEIGPHQDGPGFGFGKYKSSRLTSVARSSSTFARLPSRRFW